MKNITPAEIQKAIINEALNIKKKQALYSQILTLNEEAKKLYEVGMVGSFGFANVPGDVSNKTKTGFVNPANISHIARLEAEMSQKELTKEEVTLNEIEKLKMEFETLKKELEEVKKSNKPTQ